MRALPLLLLLTACGDKAEGTDADGDGAPAATDCDDDDPARAPGLDEVCDGVDNDCDEQIDEEPTDGETFYADADGDGAGDPSAPVEACALPAGAADNRDDCDDTEPAAYLGADEVCDGVDNDCDGRIDDSDSSLDPSTQADFYRDADGDGYGVEDDVQAGCDAPDGYVAEAGDCDDLEPDRNPGQDEVCDGLDNDCDGLVDDDDDSLDLSTAETFWTDMDGDGYGDPEGEAQACVAPAGAADRAGDCDDNDPTLSPDAFDSCGNGIDDNCDDRIDETCPVSAALADHVLLGAAAADAAGASLDASGDIDGDSRADLLVGARFSDVAGEDAGAATLLLGPATATADLSAAALTLTGAATGDEAGVRVRHARDLDRDGYGELLVAARASDAGALDGGAMHLVYGPITGAISLGDAVTLSGADERASLGEYALGPAGDLNNDGVADLFAGAWGLDTASLDVGAVYVFFGPVTADRSTDDADLRVVGDALFDQAGGAGATAGDLDGDGLDDLLVAVPGADRVALFFGARTADDLLVSEADARLSGVYTDAFGAAVAVGDLDGDGHPEIVVGAPFHDDGARSTGALFGFAGPVSTNRLYSAADFTLVGPEEQTLLGTGSAELATGDLDGDGVHELVVGSVFDDGGGNRAGAGFAFRGPMSGTLDLVDAWRTVEGEAADDSLGAGVAVGDLDGDGLGDLILGAPQQDAAAADAGAVYLFFGSGL